MFQESVQSPSKLSPKSKFNKKAIEDKIIEAEMLNLSTEVLLLCYVDIFKDIGLPSYL